jgi:peptide-methionine (S)-S-oxide reductase
MYRVASDILLINRAVNAMYRTRQNLSIAQAAMLASFLLTVSAPAAWAEKAYFAGGCFWCMESDFEALPGVEEVVSGFSGGTLKNPTYNGDHTGHYETVEITYDPAQVSYAELLAHYWVNIDPFDPTGQFCDKGPSYRAAIFVATPEERQLAVESKRKVEMEFPDQKVVTEILDASTFYPVMGDESYHQDYYKNNPIRYKFYRYSCGRDARLEQIWGDRATH